MKTKMTSQEQRLFGYTSFKLELLDTLIDYSIKCGGNLTTAELRSLRDGLESYSHKMEIAETLEEDNKNAHK